MNPLKSIEKAFESFKEVLFEKYKGDPAKIMIHAGTLGWILSSAAQLWNVATSDKFTSNEKKFLIPQETMDAVVNIAFFYLLTNNCKKLSDKLVSTGKLLSKPLREYVKAHPIAECKLGDFNTNLKDFYDSDKEFYDKFHQFKNGVNMAVNTVACVVASNILAPVVRNKIASYIQKDAILDEKSHLQTAPKNILPMRNGVNMNDYMRNSLAKSGINSGIKI